MSAYIVAREHIDLLVRLALEGPAGVPVNPGTAWYGAPRGMTPDAIGQLLTDECVRSVAHRYGEAPEAGTLPGPVDRWYLAPYVYRRPVHRLTVPEALKALDGWEYQSCEHPAFRDSAAFALADELRGAVIHYVPGYDPAPWTWDAADLEGLTA